MAITPAGTWLAGSGAVNGYNVGASPGGSNLFLLVPVWWEQASNPNVASLTIGGQTSTTRVLHTTVAVSGLDIFMFDAAKIAAFSNNLVASTAYSAGNAGISARYFNSTNGVTFNAQGYGNVTAGATVTINTPSPGAADFLIMVGVLQISSLTFGALSAGYTERLDFAPGGMRCGLADATARGAESPTWTVSSATDIKAAVLGIVETAAAGVTLTSLGGDNVITSNETNVVSVGTGFGAAHTGPASAGILDGPNYAEVANYDSWADTTAQFDFQLGDSRYGDRLFQLTNSSGQSATLPITVNPPAGVLVTNMTTLRALTFDLRNKPSRIYDSPTDIPDGAQVEIVVTGGTGSVTLDTDGRLRWPTTVTQITIRWNDGAGWSAVGTWDLTGPFQAFQGPPIADETLERNAAITPRDYSTLFTNTDGSALTYSMVPSIPGLTIGASSGIVSGAPTAAATYNWVVRTTNVEGHVEDSNQPEWIVQDPPVPPGFTGPIPDGPTFTVGVAITPINYSGYFPGATGWAIVPNPPITGLSFATGTGILSGTPTVATVSPGVVITGSNSQGSSPPSNGFLLQSVSATPNPPTFNGHVDDVSLPPGVGTYQLNVSIYFTGTGTYSPTVQFPTGLTMDPNTGILVGDRTVEFAWAGQIVKTNNDGSATSNSFTFQVDSIFATIPTPALVGDTEGVAVAALEALELIADPITQDYSATVPAGIVLSQFPDAGVPVLAGTSISLVISLGARPLVPGSGRRPRRLTNTYR